MLTDYQKSFHYFDHFTDWTVDCKNNPTMAKAGLTDLEILLPRLLEEGEKWTSNSVIKTEEDMKELISLWWDNIRSTLCGILFSEFWENCTKEMYDYLKKVVLTYDRFVYDPVLKMLMKHECWCDINRIDKKDPEYKIREEYIK